MTVPRLFLLVALSAATAFSAMAEDAPRRLAVEFEKNAAPFGGAMTHAPGLGLDGSGAGRLANVDKRWVESEWKFGPEGADLVRFSFDYQTKNAAALAIRFVDATGQNFQRRLALIQDGAWHTVEIDSFHAGRAWGGADDKQWHAPARAVRFVLEQAQAEVLLDRVVALARPASPPALPEGKPRVAADFEQGVVPFGGAMAQAPGAGMGGSGAGRLSNADQRWVESVMPAPEAEGDLIGFSFAVKSDTADALGVRFVDDTGQVFQRSVPLAADGEWHTVVIHQFGEGRSWGGANDKTWHPPLKSMRFILERKNAEVLLDDVTFYESEQRTPRPLGLAPGAMPFGHIHHAGPGEPEPAFILETTAARVRYTVQDHFLDTVAEGEAPATAGRLRVPTPAGRLGYFFGRFAALDEEGREVAKLASSLAVIAPMRPPAELPDNPFGVMTHFAQGWDVDFLPLMARLGVGSIRDEHYWKNVEPRPGEFVFSAQSDRYMAEAKRLGLDVMVAMTFGNPHYDGGHAPATDAGRAAYARYGQALLAHYGGQIKWLEMWNEYNGTWCGGEAQKDRPRYYAEMAKAAYPVLKKDRPDVLVGGCATVLIPMPYLEGVFRHGGLAAMDRVVIHPYRGAPEGVEDEVAALRDLMRRYNDGQDKPIWVTETGRMDRGEFPWETGERWFEKGRRYIAKYLVRQYTLLLSQEVELIHWYLARDYGSFLSMGLTRDADSPLGRYAPAPAYPAYANLVAQLYGAKIVGRETAADPFTHVWHFRREAGRPNARADQPADALEEDIRVAWTVRRAAPLTLKTDTPLVIVDLMGNAETLTPLDGRVHLTLDDNPVYIRGPVAAVDLASDGFSVPPEQRLDLRAPFALRYQSGNATEGGEFSARPVGGDATRAPVRVQDGATASLVLSSADSHATGTVAVDWRRRHADGRTAGRGRVYVDVVDPIRWARAPSPRNRTARIEGGTVDFALTNDSTEQTYALTGLRWRADGAPERQTPLAAELRPGETVEALWTGVDVEPYRPRHVRVAAEWRDRAPSEASFELAYNPVYAHPAAGGLPTADGPLGGAIRLQWTPQALSLSWARDLRVDGDAVAIRVAVAPLTAGRWGEGVAPETLRDWREFRFHFRPEPAWTPIHPAGKADAQAPVALRAEEPGLMAEIPWSALSADIKPAPGVRLRLALVVENARGEAVAAWGGGLARALEPDRFAILTLEDAPPGEGESDPAAVAEARATVTSAPATTRTLSVWRPVADSEADYGKEQGYKNNFYGYYAGQGGKGGDGRSPAGPWSDDDFLPMDHTETMWGYKWMKAGLRYLALGENVMHPERADGRPVWAVRRWVNPGPAGRLRLRGHFRHGGGQGDGVDAYVLVDGVAVWSAWIGGDPKAGRAPREDFDLTVPAEAGARIDFAVGPGPAMHLDHDAANYAFRIDREDKP